MAKAFCQRAFATPGLQPWCRKGSLTENLCDNGAAGLLTSWLVKFSLVYESYDGKVKDLAGWLEAKRVFYYDGKLPDSNVLKAAKHLLGN